MPRILIYKSFCILISVESKIASLSIDAFDVRLDPFKENLQNIRPHLGQIKTAQAIRTNLEGSEISKQNKTQVQDPYSFRCIPQVHGATKDTLNYVSSVFETEINCIRRTNNADS